LFDFHCPQTQWGGDYFYLTVIASLSDDETVVKIKEKKL